MKSEPPLTDGTANRSQRTIRCAYLFILSMICGMWQPLHFVRVSRRDAKAPLFINRSARHVSPLIPCVCLGVQKMRM